MRKQTQRRISRTKTFSFPPETAEFIEKRGQSSGVNSESEYILRLVEFDRRHNTLAQSIRQDAEALSN